MQTLIAVRGSPNCGKTAVICNAYDQLVRDGWEIVQDGHLWKRRLPKEMKCGVLRKDDVKVGSHSLGDSPGQIREGFDYLVSEGCSVIVCASRVCVRSRFYSVTEQFVEEELANELNWSLVWIDKESHPEANRRRADQVTTDRIIEEIETAVKKIVDKEVPTVF